uniref:UDP-glycosyltransferases domain-containing protein n=1 Tax=Oryza brachyantha TaxID=4533 RepID=J3N1B2_ORYBR
MAAAEELHFLLVPLAAQGHIIPMVEVGGGRVTVVTTPVNAARNRAAVEGARREGVEIELTEVAFPGREFGLPDGVENMDQLVDLAMYQAFFKAFWSMEAALEEYVTILSHPAAGGFVTHCGWNATLEAISHGVPTLTWPIFSDQFSSERLLVDVLGVGVRSGVKVPTLFLPAEAEGVHVASADVVKVVTELMDGGAEGAARRARAKEFAAKATAAVEEGGSSHADLTDMIGYISELSTKKQLGEKSTNNTEADAALSVVPS